MPRLKAGASYPVTIEINGVTRTGYAEPRTQLADFLRHELELTGTHVGCEHGVCGACTVLVDGDVARSCLMFAVQADNRVVRTVESLADVNELSELQKAFSRHGALQCGFCTPGILMSTMRFIEQYPQPTEDDVRDMLSGHICRCTGYQSIVDAIMEYAALLQETTKAAE